MEKERRVRPPEGARWWQPDLGREDVASFAAKQAMAYFAEHPESVSFALGVNDGLLFGESAETKALTMPVRWFRERPDYSNLVFTFMNRAAEELSRSYPDKYLGALAYYWAEQVPDFAVHPQVIPFLTADRSQGYDPEFLAEDRELQRRWVAALRAGSEKYEGSSMKEVALSKASAGKAIRSEQGAISNQQSAISSEPIALSKELEANDSQLTAQSSQLPRLRLGLYDYLEGAGFLIPRQHPHLLAEHLRYSRQLGFTDYFGEGMQNWGLDGPQPWLVAQLLQDPEQSAEILLEEYYQRYFQEAAKPMRRFYERCEEQWMNQPGDSYWLKFYRNETQAILFPPEICRELRGYLDEAASLVRQRKVRAHVQQVSDAFGVTERFVAMQTWRDRLNREVLSGKAEMAKVVLWLKAFRKARGEFIDYSKQLGKEQPLLVTFFEIDDFLKHDPTVNSLLWIRELSEAVEPILPADLRGDPEVEQHWSFLAKEGRSVVGNGALQGMLRSPRIVAGLPYQIALPKPWISRVEPAERFQAEFTEDGDRALRIEGSINTSITQWRRVAGSDYALAGVAIRGQLSPSSSAYLGFAWLDADHRYLGEHDRILLPTGKWPDWQNLNVGGFVPEGAVWVGVGVRLGNQREEDWIELKEFRLEVKE